MSDGIPVFKIADSGGTRYDLLFPVQSAISESKVVKGIVGLNSDNISEKLDAMYWVGSRDFGDPITRLPYQQDDLTIPGEAFAKSRADLQGVASRVWTQCLYGPAYRNKDQADVNDEVRVYVSRENEVNIVDGAGQTLKFVLKGRDLPLIENVDFTMATHIRNELDAKLLEYGSDLFSFGTRPISPGSSHDLNDKGHHFMGGRTAFYFLLGKFLENPEVKTKLDEIIG